VFCEEVTGQYYMIVYLRLNLCKKKLLIEGAQFLLWEIQLSLKQTRTYCTYPDIFKTFQLFTVIFFYFKAFLCYHSIRGESGKRFRRAEIFEKI